MIELCPSLQRRVWRFASWPCLAFILFHVGAPQSRAASIITNVVPVNVTPSSFSIAWRTDDSTPSIAVFADAAGATDLAGQLAIEAFPLQTGNPDAATAYDRRLSQASLRQKTKSLGLMLMRVSGCRPNTTYYYRLTSTSSGGNSIVYPASGPLPGVTTETENSFVKDAQQLIIDVPGLDTMGRLVLLTHTNAAHPLAAIVGDGVATNQVFFNLSDLFALAGAGGGNFMPLGSQTFLANVLSPGFSDSLAQFTLTFTADFSSAKMTHATVGTEFLAISIGSAILRTGQSTNVPLTFNANVGVTNLDLTLNVPAGYLTNFVLQTLAAEVDPTATTVTAQGTTGWLLHLGARSGQAFTGNKQLAQLAFSAIAGQHSAFVPLRLAQINAAKAGGTLATNLFGQSGRAVVVGPEPLVEATQGTGGGRSLILYGKPYSSYAIEYATSLQKPTWTRLPYRVPMTTLSVALRGLEPAPAQVYYRAVEFFADPPMLDAFLNRDQSRQLLVYGQPSKSYTIEYRTNLSGVAAWYPAATITLTNSFGYQSVAPTGPMIFYRAKKN